MTQKTAVDVLREAAELKELKSKDYQGGKWTEEDYFPFGSISYIHMIHTCLLYTSPSPRDRQKSRMPSSA